MSFVLDTAADVDRAEEAFGGVGFAPALEVAGVVWPGLLTGEDLGGTADDLTGVDPALLPRFVVVVFGVDGEDPATTLLLLLATDVRTTEDAEESDCELLSPLLLDIPEVVGETGSGILDSELSVELTLAEDVVENRDAELSSPLLLVGDREASVDVFEYDAKPLMLDIEPEVDIEATVEGL